MEVFYLLAAGLQVSLVHAYLIWVHQGNRKWSLSEHVILDRRSHAIYFTSHVICEILFFLFSYQFYIVNHDLPVLHYINIVFILLDFVQASVPSRGKTEYLHSGAAYISWCCYLLSGILAFFSLDIAQPFAIIAVILLLPTVGMFLYVHFRRSRLWFYQLLIVPMFVLYLSSVVVGAN